MNLFKSNKIISNSDAIYELLRSARKEKELSVDQVVKGTGIAKKYIDLIENGGVKKLPKGIYGRNYIREYALYLELDLEEILKLYDKEIGEENLKMNKGLFVQQRAKHKRTFTVPQMAKNALVIALISFCFIYLSIYLKRITTPPLLDIIFPTENYITEQNTIKVIGISEPEVQLIINGEQILTGTNGEFSKDVFLKSGVNIITISAKHKFGRENIVKRQLLVK